MRRVVVSVARFALVVTLAFLTMAGSVNAKEVVLNFAINLELRSPDPIQKTGNTDYVLAYNLYEPLVYPTPEKGKIVQPWIAESWTMSADGKVYTFKIRPGILFHDGSEITADDVVFSMDRMLALKGASATYFSPILDVGQTKAVDKYTVRFHLKKASPSFLASLLQLQVINEDLLMANKQPGPHGKYGDYGVKYLETHDAGSGPYILKKVKYAEVIELEKFPQYWRGWKKNQVDRVVMRIIPEDVTRAAMLRTGELDMVDWSLSKLIFDQLEKAPGVVVRRDPNLAVWLLTMNNKKPPLDDVYVRRALSYAFQYEDVVNIVGGSQAEGPVPNLLGGHASSGVQVYQQNLAKAKEMLGKSKYSAQELAKCEIVINTIASSERFRRIALSAISAFSKIGINARIENVTWPQLCELCTKPDTAPHMAVFYQAADIPHPYYFLVYYTPDGWGSSYPPGGVYYDNDKVAKLIQSASAVTDQGKQIELYEEAQRLISQEAACIFMLNDMHMMAYRDYVKGYRFPVGAQVYDMVFYNLTIEK